MNTRRHILVIDDEENLRHMLSVMLAKQEYSVQVAANGLHALELINTQVFDFILCDIRMPEMDGKQFLRAFLERRISTPVIMMSAYGTVDTAIECMKLGAYDFISKPFKKDEISMVLRKAEERERLKLENSSLRKVVSGLTEFEGIIGRSSSILAIFDQIGKVADLKTTVLVLGESGTGKELVARAIHNKGQRSLKPFIAVNCGAIPATLLESELFGHVRGAFTDAACDKAGLFEQADGGTLFLDEIGEMPLSLQVKLLRVLQEDEIRKIGAATSRKVNVRVVSATSRDLDEAVKTGGFREDLYFRLNVFTISLPPLRNRVDDIPLLVEYFLRKYSAEMNRDSMTLSSDALRCLLSYQWPGNIRELQNAIERSLIMTSGTVVMPESLPAIISSNATHNISSNWEENLSIKKAEDAIERNLIRKALIKTGGNRTQAAKILEISHRSLLYKLKEFGIE